jgi:hypothetical protein
MAAIVEVYNPVNRRIIERSVGQEDGVAAMFASGDSAANKAAQRAAAAEVIARTAGASTEVYAMVLTWISVTAGLAPVLYEWVGTLRCTAIAGVWVFVSGIAGMRFFQFVDYYDFGGPTRFLGVARTSLLSGLLVLTNLIVLAVIWGWYSCWSRAA